MAKYNTEEILRDIFDSDSEWKPSQKIPLVNKEIEHLKSDLKLFLNNSDYNIEALLAETDELSVESKALVTDLEICKNEFEKDTMAEILKSLDNYEMISKELKAVDFAVNMIYDVVQCGNIIKTFESEKGIESLNLAVEGCTDLFQYISMPAEGFLAMDVYSNTKETAEILKEKLYKEICDRWEKMVVWNIKPGTRKTVITIILNMDKSYPVIDVLNGLHKSNMILDKVGQFSNFLLKDVLTAIIHNDCTVYADTEELMTITVTHKQNYKPPYSAVIANLRLLFHYLSNKLNVLFERQDTVMTMIGKAIATSFRDILVKDCLLDTIPNNINELQGYGKVTSDIEEFQRFLVVINFISEDFTILEYIKNIDVLFADKSSQHFLETARLIMLKDLSVTMSIGVENIPNNPGTSAQSEADGALAILDKTMPRSLFYFPRCMISKTAQELLDLVYVMMEQAVQCSDVVCKKLYNTTRLVFELYDAVVPCHHENYLQTIPQYVALFHNNCMYLAHNLQTFGDKWLMLMEGRELDYPISFVDLVQNLRELGYKHLTIHMQQQRKQILDNIRSSDLNNMAVKDVLGENAEAAIRQCLRQLQILKNVWIGVFPSNVFTRLISTLVNMFVEELIHRVCSVEDISVEMAAQLIDFYALVIQKAPQLFQTPSDIDDHVNSWPKLKELIFILGGSLKDIENHWDDGTGPLAKHFKTEEIRSLIKALFQNTQFRANLLSKIK